MGTHLLSLNNSQSSKYAEDVRLKIIYNTIKGAIILDNLYAASKVTCPCMPI